MNSNKLAVIIFKIVIMGPKLLVEVIEFKALAQIRAARPAIKNWNDEDPLTS